MIGNRNMNTSQGFARRLAGYLSVPLGVFAVLSACSEAGSNTAAPTAVKVECKWTVGDEYRYRTLANINGTMKLPGESNPTPVNVDLEMVMKYSVVKPTVRDSTEIMINTESASLVLGDNRIPAPTSPQTVVRLDPAGRIVSISGTDRTMGLSGVNINTLMVLLVPVFPEAEMKVGQEWSSETNVASIGRKLSVRNVLLDVERVNEHDTVRVKQSFELLPMEGEAANTGGITARGEAVSNFSVKDGRLVKSQAEMAVKSEEVAEKDSPSMDAKIKLDVNLLPK